MRNDAQLLATSELSYLDASKVSSPAGALSELDVLSAEGRRLGSIEGVVIDAAARRVRYLSVRYPVGLVAGDTSWPPIN